MQAGPGTAMRQNALAARSSRACSAASLRSLSRVELVSVAVSIAFFPDRVNPQYPANQGRSPFNDHSPKDVDGELLTCRVKVSTAEALQTTMAVLVALFTDVGIRIGSQLRRARVTAVDTRNPRSTVSSPITRAHIRLRVAA